MTRRLDDFDAIVFDMDGVLIDTRQSFTECVLRTAAQCALKPGLGEGWTESHVEELRLSGGFNDDLDASAALAIEGARSTPGAVWSAVCGRLRQTGGGPASVIRRSGDGVWRVTRSIATLVFQRLYAGSKSAEVYGVPPTQNRGLYENEKPLIGPDELESIGKPWGIYTGRSPGETALGLRILGVELLPARLICASEDRFLKPRPDALLTLAGSMKARRLAFVGDNPDDLRAAKNAREAGLDVGFFGIAPTESERESRFLKEGALAVAGTVREFLPELSRRRRL